MGASVVFAADVGSVGFSSIVISTVRILHTINSDRRQLSSKLWRLGIRVVAHGQPVESLLERSKRACDYRDPKSTGLVSSPRAFYKITWWLVLTCYKSVSSVRTLEAAKVARGCLYMQVPVQEVCLLS
jgi:hypothetical protein